MFFLAIFYFPPRKAGESRRLDRLAPDALFGEGAMRDRAIWAFVILGTLAARGVAEQPPEMLPPLDPPTPRATLGLPSPEVSSLGVQAPSVSPVSASVAQNPS